MSIMSDVMEVVYLTVLPVGGYIAYALVARMNASGFASLGQFQLPMSDWLIVLGMLLGIFIIFRLVVKPLTQASEAEERQRKVQESENKYFPSLGKIIN